MDKRDRLFLCSALALSLLARIAFLCLRPPTLADPDNYAEIARSLAAGEGYRLQGRLTAYRPPLYPLVLLPGAWLPGGLSGAWVAFINVSAGLAAVALVMRTARAWGLSPRRAAIGGLIVGLDPVLLGQAGAIMTEPLAAALVALALCATTTRGPLLAGLAWGLAALCRPSLLAIGGTIALLRGFASPGPRPDRLRSSAWMALGIALVLAPWAARNAAAFGRPIWTTTHGGYTLALGNNPAYYRDILDGKAGAVWSGSGQKRWFDEMTERTKGQGEMEVDRFLETEAWRVAREQPADFLRASADRIARLWGLAPSAAVYPAPLRAACFAWTLPLWIALALGSVRCAGWPRWPALVALAITTCVHAVFWTDMRMRAPIVPAIALIAICAPGLEFRRFFRKQASL